MWYHSPTHRRTTVLVGVTSDTKNLISHLARRFPRHSLSQGPFWRDLSGILLDQFDIGVAGSFRVYDNSYFLVLQVKYPVISSEVIVSHEPRVIDSSIGGSESFNLGLFFIRHRNNSILLIVRLIYSV